MEYTAKKAVLKKECIDFMYIFFDNGDLKKKMLMTLTPAISVDIAKNKATARF